MSSVASSPNEPEGAGEQMHRDQELEALRQEVRELRTTKRTARMHAEFLVRATTELLSASGDYDETTKRIASIAVPTLADWCVIYVVERDSPAGRPAAVAHVDPTKEKLAGEVMQRSVPDPSITAGPYQVIRTGLAEVYETITDELLARGARDPEHLRLLRELRPCSSLVVPMKVDGRTVGALMLVYTTSGRSYSIEELETAEELARTAALALNNARILRAEQQARSLVERSAERMDALRSIMGSLGACMTKEAIADVVMDQGATALGALQRAICLFDDAGKAPILIRSRGEGSSPMALLAQDAACQAMRDGAPVLLEPRSTDHLVVISLPIMIGRRPIGAIAFGFPGTRVIDDVDRRFLLLFAEHSAHALDRARVLEAEKRARSELALLNQLADGVNRARCVEDVYAPALDAVDVALGCGRCAVSLFDGDGVMRFKATRGISEEYRRAVEGHNPWSKDEAPARLELVHDTHDDVSLASYRRVFDAERIRSLAFIPLSHSGRLLGKLMLYREAPGTLTEEQVSLALTIATQVAQAVNRQLSGAKMLRLFHEAEAANRMKDEFLAVVSHELRTPLSAIVGWASILRTERRFDPDAVAKGIAVIERNAQAQAKIIEDILDVSRIIRGKLVIDARPVSLVGIVGEAVEPVRAAAAAKDIVLDVHPTDDPYAVIGDPVRLRQIVWNLLSNAIKFTPPDGRVDVVLSRGRGTIELAVTDTGAGIARELLPHVFERFRQADGSTSRRHGGLGLGLAIVRHLVELHGGQVLAESPGPGKGSTFRVTIPVRAAYVEGMPEGGETARRTPNTVATTAETTDLTGVRVLVVDDEADARDMLGEILAGAGASVDVAASAADASSLIVALRPDVLVSDVGMPGEDGYSLMRRVRAAGGATARTPAIALTAYARPEDAQRALGAGFELHLAKPIDASVLITSVARLAKH